MSCMCRLSLASAVAACSLSIFISISLSFFSFLAVLLALHLRATLLRIGTIINSVSSVIKATAKSVVVGITQVGSSGGPLGWLCMYSALGGARARRMLGFSWYSVTSYGRDSGGGMMSFIALSKQLVPMD